MKSDSPSVLDSVLGSIQASLTPIRKEGGPFLAIAGALTLILGWLWQPLFWLLLIFTAWIAYFFRDPTRVSPADPAIVVSPADGRICFADEFLPPPELQLGEGKRQRVSIFMSVFDCHVNRSPVAGRLKHIAYTPGKFLNASLDKASEDNERNALVIETAHGEVGVVQIAGLVARRILCWVKPGKELLPGERIGMIRFGSRLDVYLPIGTKLRVSLGQTAIAGETVLARFGGQESADKARVD